MPIRSKISQLPEEIREELNKKLVGSGFSRYEELRDWLETKGYRMTTSTVGNYAKKYAEKVEALRETTELAKAISDAIDDNENDLADVLTRLTQHQAMQALLNLDVEGDNAEKVLASLGNMVATLNRTSVAIRKYKDEVKDRALHTAEEIDRTVRQQGLSEETAAAIRMQILGIAG